MTGPARLRSVGAMTRNAPIRVAAAITAGLVAAGSVAGCGLSTNRFSDEHTEAVALTAITTDGGSGSVTVSSGPAGSVRVLRHVTYRGTKPGATDQRSGTTLALKTTCGSQCSVSYEVTAPAGVRVSGHSGSGALNLSDVSTVGVDVGSGAVTVRQASGDVNVQTGSGAVRLTGISGPAVVNTGSGAVTVQVTGPGNVTVRTGSGAIRVTVPSGVRYRVNASSDSGHVDVNVPTDPAAEHAIDVHSGSGAVIVEAG